MLLAVGPTGETQGKSQAALRRSTPRRSVRPNCADRPPRYDRAAGRAPKEASLRRLLVVSLAALFWAVILSGCGGSKSSSNGVASKSADDIVTAAKDAADSATSVHAYGSGSDNGVPLVIDLHILSGKGGKGSLSEHGLSFELIRIGPTAYIKGSRAFYKKFAGPAAAQLLQGKWLKASATTGQLASLTPLTDLRRFFDTALASHGKLKKTGTTTMHGVQVVGVEDTTKGGTLYVATTGKAYPIEVTQAGTSGGTLSFDQWDQPVSLAAPPNAVDISKLKG
jgi:hypothetical protein